MAWQSCVLLEHQVCFRTMERMCVSEGRSDHKSIPHNVYAFHGDPTAASKIYNCLGIDEDICFVVRITVKILVLK